MKLETLEAVRTMLADRHAALTKIRWGVPYGYLKTIKSLKRIEKLQEKTDRRIRVKRAIKYNQRFNKEVSIAYRNWRSRKRFMSIDVERTEEGVFHEVGVTLIRGSSIESFNYRVKGIERGPKFIFGNNIESDIDYIRSMVLLHAQSTDAYIGNDFRHDLRHLEAEGIELPRHFYYDTSDWGFILLGYRPSLYVLTQQFGVGSTQMHCGGNDSRYTAEVFLKIINTYGADNYR